MPTRRITYADQLAVSLFAMEDALQRMLDEGFLAQAILGTTTQLDGFDCTPSSPADLTVNVAGGTIFKYENVDDTAFGELPSQIPADTTNQVVKYATQLDSTPFTITPPATVGFSRNDLIQINFQEQDGDSESVPFWNGTNVNGVPNPPVFSTKNVRRIDSVVINVKNGTAAATGTQVTPSPDAGYVGAWVVTTANGQTTITSGDIAEFTNAPFITEKLKDKISQATADLRYGQITTIQSGGYLYALDTGTANTYVAALSPAISSYTDGMKVRIKIANANTGASTLNLNSLGAVSIAHGDGTALLAGDLTANALMEFIYSSGANKFILDGVQQQQFANSLSANGYQKLPGGLIIQWGVSGNINAGDDELITYPVPFPTAAVHISIVPLITIPSTDPVSGGYDPIDLTQFSLFNRSNVGPIAFTWQAIGY